MLISLSVLAALGVGAVQWRAAVRETQAEAAHPPLGHIVDVDGVPIHLHDFGGTGPDLILIHGAGGNTREFGFDFAEKLTGSYRVIAVDRPGLGWSGRPDGYAGAWKTTGEGPRVQARLLAGAVAQLGVERPIVLGHSFGGAVAMGWALEYPDTTAGIVTLGGVSHPWPGELGWTYWLNGSSLGGGLVIPVLSAFVPESYVRSTIDSIFEPQKAPDGYAEYVAPGLTLRRNTLRANARQVNTLRPHIVDMAEEYPALTLPIEIVHGDADTIVPLTIHGVPLSERVDSAALTVLEGVGHMPHHADPKAVIAAIDRVAARAGLR